MDLKENEKLNKMLIFKKNELKRLIKNTSMPNKIENKVTKKDCSRWRYFSFA